MFQKAIERARAYFSRAEPEPLLALPPPVLTEVDYWQAKIDSANAELARLREEGAERAELENARWDRDVAEANLRDVHAEQAEEWRGNAA